MAKIGAPLHVRGVNAYVPQTCVRVGLQFSRLMTCTLGVAHETSWYPVGMGSGGGEGGGDDIGGGFGGGGGALIPTVSPYGKRTGMVSSAAMPHHPVDPGVKPPIKRGTRK
jgi:hypothetical protein